MTTDTRDAIRGDWFHPDGPDWSPLLKLVGEDYAPAFMCMFLVELEDGRRMHAFKSIDSRRYLYIADDGTAFGWLGDDMYRPRPAYPMIRAEFGRLTPEEWLFEGDEQSDCAEET